MWRPARGIDGMIAGADYVLGPIPDRQTPRFVPGHGPGHRPRTASPKYRQTCSRPARDRIADAKEERPLSEDDMMKANFCWPDLDKRWRAPGPNPPRFPRLVYQSVEIAGTIVVAACQLCRNLRRQERVFSLR